MVVGRRKGNKGTGRKKIEIKKIEKSALKSSTFSKRKKSLFDKARDLEEKAGATVAILVFSPAGKPFFRGDIDSAFKALQQEAPSTSNAPPTDMNNGGTSTSEEGFHRQ